MHAYALLKTPDTPLALPQGTQNPLEWVSVGDVSAVVEHHLNLENLQQDDQTLLDAVLAHDRIVQELFWQTTVLPLRFTSFPLLDDLCADLKANQTAYLKKLAELEGKAEYLLKLVSVDLVEETSVSPDLKGKNYFLAKKQQFQRLQEQRLLQTEALQRLKAAIAHTFPQHQIVPGTEGGHTVYLLIDHMSKRRLERALAAWKVAYPLWEFTLSAGVPPYHFI